MTLLEIIKKTKIDFGKTVLERCSGSGATELFEIIPRNFLMYAKADFKEGVSRGLINSLTNSKRAIDCQTDFALQVFGIEYHEIPKQSKKIIDLTDLNKEDIPYKLKLIHALNMAPSGLISKTRTLRNKLEHYYKKPSPEEVKEALELAELFILSLESKLNNILDEFIISDTENYNIDLKKQIYVYYDLEKKKFKLVCSNSQDRFEEEIILETKDEAYFGLLRVMNSINNQNDTEDSMKLLLQIINHPMPKENIKLIII